MQYAAICFRRIEDAPDPIEILLVTSRDTGRWVIPKGWPMGRRKPHAVARREAWEEAGARGRIRRDPWGRYAYVKRLRGGERVPACVQVHLLKVRTLDADFPEHDQRMVRWFAPGDAASAVVEPELAELIGSLAVAERLRLERRRIAT